MTRFAPVLILAPLALLAACATPQQACLNKASIEVRAVQSQMKTIEGNLARGYAVHKQQVPYQVMKVCENKEGKKYPCPETMWRTEEQPVAVDMDEQRAQLAALKAKLPALRRAYEAEADVCRATYPE